MKELSVAQRVVLALMVMSSATLFLYLVGYLYYDASVLSFLNWNLLLAWIPLLCVLWLRNYLKTGRWLSWQAIGASLLWLAFLPNSFYIVSDLMHLNRIYTDNPLYYAVLLFSYSLSGLLLGLVSLYIMQKQIAKRVNETISIYFATAIIMFTSFAIYFGRYLRWSSWDIILNPAGLVFDVSDRILNPELYGQTFAVSAILFVFIFSIYLAFWLFASVTDIKKGDN